MARKNLKPTLLSMAIATGLAAGAPTTAQALSLGISGQINKQISNVDNGNDSSLGVFDNGNSGTRFRFTGSEDLGNGLKVGGVWEWQWQNTPSGTDFTGAAPVESEIREDAATTLSDRKAEIYFASNWGKISIGKGDGAGNGAQEVDLSGTTLFDYANGAADQLGGVSFRTANDGKITNAFIGGTNALTVGRLIPNLDMFSRNNRIRYDTPQFGKAFSVAISQANAGLTEVALWVDVSFGSTKLAAALATGSTGDAGTTTTETDRDALSASLLLGNGLNFTISSATSETDAVGSPETERTSFKVGYKKGKHAFSAGISGTEFSGTGAPSAEPSSTGLAWTYSMAKDVEIYAGWMEADADIAGVDDISTLTIGSRIRWK